MIEPITATATAFIADRVCDHASRVHIRRKLLALAPTLPPGSEVGETPGGWYIKTSPTALTAVGER